MELIKEISKTKLVIMVTHNPEIAKKYSDRIVRVKDGEIQEDTNPYVAEEVTDNGFALKKTAIGHFNSAIKSSFKEPTYEEVPYVYDGCCEQYRNY